MRLTKDIKTAIVRSIMSAIDSSKLEQANKDYFNAYIELRLSISPVEVRMLWHNAATRALLTLKTEYLAITKPDGRTSSIHVPPVVSHAQWEDTLKAHKTLEMLRLAAEKEGAAFSEIRSRVNAAVESCSTRKQLIDRYPEWEKFCPNDQTIASPRFALADPSLMVDLRKLGFPDGKKKADPFPLAVPSAQAQAATAAASEVSSPAN